MKRRNQRKECDDHRAPRAVKQAQVGGRASRLDFHQAALYGCIRTRGTRLRARHSANLWRIWWAAAPERKETLHFL